MSKNKPMGCLTVIAVGFAIIMGIAVISSVMEGSGSGSGSASAGKSAAQIEAERRAALTDAQMLDEIEARMKSQREKLKRFYATASDLSEIEADALTVVVIRAKGAAEGADAATKADASRAGKLARPLVELQREIFASVTENAFMKDGLDMDVDAVNREKKTLRVRYVLMSRALSYQLHNQGRLGELAAGQGFSRVVYADTSGSTWTYAL